MQYENVTVQADVNIAVTIKCSGCGKSLYTQSVIEVSDDEMVITVEPCDECMEVARRDGHDDGFTRGYNVCKEEVRDE